MQPVYILLLLLPSTDRFQQVEGYIEVKGTHNNEITDIFKWMKRNINKLLTFHVFYMIYYLNLSHMK